MKYAVIALFVLVGAVKAQEGFMINGPIQAGSLVSGPVQCGSLIENARPSSSYRIGSGVDEYINGDYLPHCTSPASCCRIRRIPCQHLLPKSEAPKEKLKAANRSLYEVYRGKNNEWYWRFLAGNGEEIFRSTDGYKNKGDCKHSIELAKGSKDAQVLTSVVVP